MQEKNLVFLVSQPRSGSTLLQMLLSNHQLIKTTNEPWLLLPTLGWFKPNLIDAKFSVKNTLKALEEFYGRGEKSAFREKIKEWILLSYGQQLNSPAEFFLDKTPRYYEILDEITEFFPKAKIILLVRDPFSVLASIIRTWKVDSLNALSPYKRDILYAPSMINEFSKKHATSENIKKILYEDLINDPTGVMKSIYQWIGIGYSEIDLNYKPTLESLSGGKMGDKVGVHSYREVNTASLSKWKKMLEISYMKNFFQGYSAFLGENLLAELGNYESLGNKMTNEFRYFYYRYGRNIGVGNGSLIDYLKLVYAKRNSKKFPKAIV